MTAWGGVTLGGGGGSRKWGGPQGCFLLTVVVSLVMTHEREKVVAGKGVGDNGYGK